MRQGIVGRVMMAQLEKVNPNSAEEETMLEGICRKLTEEALEGNLTAANMIFDRIEGRPAQQMSEAQLLQMLLTMDTKQLAGILGIPIEEIESRLRQSEVLELEAEKEDMTKMESLMLSD